MVTVHNTQQSNTSREAGGGVTVWRLSSSALGAPTMHHTLPSFPTDAYKNVPPASIAASATLYLQGIRLAVTRGWGGGGRLIGLARV